MPVFDAEAWVGEAIESILAQTLRDWELICVDDGSEDRSAAILEEYAQKDERISVVRRAHENAGAARNAGLEKAKGEWLIFLDSDDVFAPRMFEAMVEAGDESAADVVVCGEENRIIERPVESVDIYSRWVGWAWDKMFRREFIERTGLRFQEIRSSNDARFTYSALAMAGRVVEVGEKFVDHRARTGSLERTREKEPLCILKAIERIRGDLVESGLMASVAGLEEKFKRWQVGILYWHLIAPGLGKGRKELYGAIEDREVRRKVRRLIWAKRIKRFMPEKVFNTVKAMRKRAIKG